MNFHISSSPQCRENPTKQPVRTAYVLLKPPQSAMLPWGVAFGIRFARLKEMRHYEDRLLRSVRSPSRKPPGALEVTRRQSDYGGENLMLDHDQVMKVAQIMGYDPRKPTELNAYIEKISKMDSWEISKILFFGAKNKEPNNQEKS